MHTSRAGLTKHSLRSVIHGIPFLLLLITLSALIAPSGATCPSRHSVSSAARGSHTQSRRVCADVVYPNIHAVHAYAGPLLIPPLPPDHQDDNQPETFIQLLNKPRVQRREEAAVSGTVTVTVTKTETETIELVRRKSIAAKIRSAFHKAGQKIKHAFQSAGHAIVHAAQKVGHFIKTTGAKIAKVGLKVVATVGKVAAKAIGFIPGAKGIGKAIEGGSEGLNKASDAIHAHVGGKLGKAMQKMDKAQKIVGYIP